MKDLLFTDTTQNSKLIFYVDGGTEPILTVQRGDNGSPEFIWGKGEQSISLDLLATYLGKLYSKKSKNSIMREIKLLIEKDREKVENLISSTYKF